MMRGHDPGCSYEELGLAHDGECFSAPLPFAPGKAVVGWADAAQYRSEPMPNGGKMAVTLINVTPDPLGNVAVLCGMYAGKVARSLGEVTDAQRHQAFQDMLQTELNGPLSSVSFLFLVEGVDRAFTHQAVRQQLAFFAQESLRFAVKEDWAAEVPLPPHLAGMRDDDPQVRIWRKSLMAVEDAYGALVAAGMPAEEARGLLPHAVTTRYYWSVNLKGLLVEAGKRTCTQAQFHWRQMFGLVAKALREYAGEDEPGNFERFDGWQLRMIADQLRPHCYQSGSCGFMAKFDRGCSIRARVEENALIRRPSAEWHLVHDTDGPDGYSPVEHLGHVQCEHKYVGPIDPREWAADPGAART
jgi:thymidylate synthase ThyX